MNKTQYINTQLIIDYISENEVAWQNYDSLMDFTCDGKRKNRELHNSLCNAKQCIVFDSTDYNGFEDIVEWASKDDLLVLVDDDLMLCIPACDKDKLIVMLA